MFLIILRGFPYNHHISWIIFSAAMFFCPFPSSRSQPLVRRSWTRRYAERGCDVMIGAMRFFHQQTNVPLDQWQATTLPTNIGHYVTTMSPLLVNFHLTKLPDFVEQKTRPSKKNIKPHFKHHRTIVVSFPCSKFSLRISRIPID